MEDEVEIRLFRELYNCFTKYKNLLKKIVGDKIEYVKCVFKIKHKKDRLQFTGTSLFTTSAHV